MQVRLFKPSVGEEELAAVQDVFERAWLGLGPKVSEFEQAWSRYIGAADSVGVNSATAALHLALAAFRFPPGKKVLVTALTFVASATCILYNRLEPVFVDVDPQTLGMDLDDLERKITPDCVAVVAVHFGGHPLPMRRLSEIAGRHGLKIVEDCAHCAGGEHDGRRLGLWGDIGCYSFEEKKCMTTGDGGMLSSQDAAIIQPLRVQRWVGIDKDTWKRSAQYTGEGDSRHWHYEVSVLGYKYNMNDLAAAIGLVQLGKLDAMNARRRAIIARYLDGIRGLRDIRPLLPYDLEGNSAYWIFGIRCPAPQRDRLIMFLKTRGVATGVHYLPLTLQPLFADHRGAAAVAEAVWQEMITLPLFPDLTDAEVDYVLELLTDFSQHPAT